MAYADKAHEIAMKINDRSLLASLLILKGTFEKLNRQYVLAEEYLRAGL
jgi:hypothetical protein